MTKVEMHDGTVIDVVVRGDGPAILIPVNPVPIEGAGAEEMRKWGVDPALGESLINGLRDQYRVVAFDYEGHVLSAAKPETLTPDNISSDFIAIADAVGASQFAYYGYSWLALCGMQLSIRTSRLSALIMGGFPPINGPYNEMLRVTMAAHEMSGSNPGTTGEKEKDSDDYDWANVKVAMSGDQTKQFVTLYQHLQDFNDQEVQSKINCPRLCFAGSVDRIEYGEQWGNVKVDIVGPLINRNEEIIEAGWDIRVLEGLDHTAAMQALSVLSVLRPWLDAKLLGK